MEVLLISREKSENCRGNLDMWLIKMLPCVYHGKNICGSKSD
jgi:hypothetical protein